LEAILTIVVLIAVIGVIMMSIILHEVAHGWMAARCGDYTAEAAGRLTLNPIKHIDPFLTVLMPIFLLYISGGRFAIGGAKPVPINPYNFRNLKKDYFKVSVAGLVVNLGLILLFILLIKVNLFPVVRRPTGGEMSFGAPIVWYGLMINLILFTFNLMPIPPLDGSRALRVLLPAHIAKVFDQLDRFGMIILLFVVFATPIYSIFFGVTAIVIQLFFRINIADYFFVSQTFSEMISGII